MQSGDYNQNKLKWKYFFPYDQKTLKYYLIYVGLFLIIGAFAIFFSTAMIVISVKNHLFSQLDNITNINLAISPIFIILLILVAWGLLLVAPQQIHRNTKKSSIIFYISFWFFIFAVLLNGATADLYRKNFITTDSHLSFGFNVLEILTIITIYMMFFLQIYFWVMRRKFSFNPTDYEIYSARIEAKRNKKSAKVATKLQKKQKSH